MPWLCKYCRVVEEGFATGMCQTPSCVEARLVDIERYALGRGPKGSRQWATAHAEADFQTVVQHAGVDAVWEPSRDCLMWLLSRKNVEVEERTSTGWTVKAGA